MAREIITHGGQVQIVNDVGLVLYVFDDESAQWFDAATGALEDPGMVALYVGSALGHEAGAL